MTIECDPVNRRPIVDFCERGVWDAQFLSHISRHAKAVDLIRRESQKLDRPVTVLDVGCGELWPLRSLIGNPWLREDQLLQRYVGVDIEWLDDSFVTGRTPYDFIKQDFNEQQGFDIEPGTVDVAIMTEVIEHVGSGVGKKLLDGIDDALAPGGLFYISTPNDDHARPEPQYHVHQWGFKELENELENRWQVEHRYGTIITQNAAKRAQSELHRLPPGAVETLRRSLDAAWFRTVMAAFYPERSENTAWVVRKLG